MFQIECLLWDFGNTLCDEMFIWGSAPEWQRVWDTVNAHAFDQWSLGALTTQQFADILAEHLPMSAEEAAGYMADRCRTIDFFPFTFDFFKSQHLPQAIVTVNPDLFSEVIVPAYDLTNFAPVIVTSWQERSLDKGHLCARALELLDIDCAPSNALLIDNRRDCIKLWSSRGGRGYHFTTDDKFKLDSIEGFGGLI